jgi:hypothetical protein
VPVGSRVERCVREVEAKGQSKGHAIPICVKSTKEDYQTGEPTKKCSQCGNPSLAETNSPRGQKVKMSVTAEQLQQALAKVRR